MIYLLDANVFITAKNTYYPFDQVPEFWEWLLFQAKEGYIKTPSEIFEELTEKGKKQSEKDVLSKWLEKKDNKDVLLLKEEVDQIFVKKVIKEYCRNPKKNEYEDELNDSELEIIQNDAFLVAYALKDPQNRCVVTTETSNPRKIRQNKKIPDICTGLKVSCCSTFELNRQLNFSTNWKDKYK